MMKSFNIIVMFANGLYSHTSHLKAENEKEALKKAIDDYFRRNDTIVSITILENKREDYTYGGR